MQHRPQARARHPGAGAFDYIAKPFDPEVLARVIAAAIIYRG
jgi:DNA-binding response OmpR family regulator